MKVNFCLSVSQFLLFFVDIISSVHIDHREATDAMWEGFEGSRPSELCLHITQTSPTRYREWWSAGCLIDLWVKVDSQGHQRRNKKKINQLYTPVVLQPRNIRLSSCWFPRGVTTAADVGRERNGNKIVKEKTCKEEGVLNEEDNWITCLFYFSYSLLNGKNFPFFFSGSSRGHRQAHYLRFLPLSFSFDFLFLSFPSRRLYVRDWIPFEWTS